MRVWNFAAQASLLALGLMLAGCGDGGGVASTPAPPPAPTYTKIVDMTGNRTFQTAGVTYNTSPTGFSNGASNTHGSGVTVAYMANSDSYTVTAPGGATQTFGPAELQTPGIPTPDSLQYVKVNGTTRDHLTLIVPSTTGGVPLSYTVVGGWGTTDTSNNTGTFRIAVGGAPTVASDMPKTGTASYTIGVLGTAVVAQAGPLGGIGYPPYNLGGDSTGTFSADFGRGTIATQLNLTGRLVLTGPGQPVATNFGTYAGSGSLASGGPGFSGTFSGTFNGAPSTGVFSGLFLGPQAVEVGYGYMLSGTGFSAVGAVVGVKQ